MKTDARANPIQTISFRLAKYWCAGLIALMLGVLLLPTAVRAQDKSGVSPQVISLPSGPGSLEGLGETFEPDLSTGTSSYPVKFTAPPGRVGFQPELSLHYNGGHANGPWGMGWKLSTPYIQRRTEDGLPSYIDAQDQFIFSNGEKLVPLRNGNYRFENESSFMRFQRLESGAWEARTPDGMRLIFGKSDNARVTIDKGVFAWKLERQIDPHGNEIRYSYLHDGGSLYPLELRYNFGNGDPESERYNAVRFNYEPRPDVYTDRRSGAPLRVGLRGTDIQMWSLGKLVRAYRFEYEPERSTGKYSLLIGVTQVGDDGESELPPHTFTYTQFDPSAYAVVTMQNPPPVGLTNPDADLVDINADGLPDLVFTPADGHRFYLNRGHGRWQAEPEFPRQSPPERLSLPNVRMADMNGDGRVDILVKAGDTPGAPFYYYRNGANGEWEKEARVDFGPAPAFNLNDPNVQLIDVNNDHSVDVVLSADGRLKIWLAREGAWSETADFDVPAPAAGDAASFDDPNIKVGDMTGDRMEDLVFVRDGMVILWPHNGNGDYDAGETVLNPPIGIGAQDVQIRMGDLNNDGLVDLVLPGNRSVQYWLSLGDGSFTDPVVMTNTPPFDAANTAVRLADIDGDGATELLYSRFPAPPDEAMMYVDFSVGPQPFLLASVDNGLGRTIRIDYKSSVEDYIADWDAGQPWNINLPFPVQVVRQVAVHDANSGDEYVIDYHYRDGYYNGAQKEFRGFVRSEEIRRGDETAATTRTRFVYDVGMDDESRKGMVLEKAILAEDGACSGDYDGCYQRTVNQLTTHVIVDGAQTATGQPIAYAYVSQTDRYIHEQQADPIQTRQTFEQDDYGNQTKAFNYGKVCGEDVTCGNDEILQYTEYIYNDDVYMFNRPQRVYETDIAGAIIRETRFYYDGPAFEGLPAGQLTRGDLTRQTVGLGPKGDNRFIPVKRQEFDAYGNVIGMMDANGNRRTVEYDARMHVFPVLERLHFADGSSLSYAASYHYGFGKVSAATDYNGHPHLFAYDTFGRITKIAKPGDTLEQPTQEFSYDIGSPRSAITTQRRVRSGEDEMLTSVEYYDGLGRKLQLRREAEDGRVVVEEAVEFNARGGESYIYLPYFADSLDYAAPDPSLPRAVQHFDPLERTVRAVNPDGTYTAIEYGPLTQVHYDEEDNRADSPHFNTPTTLTFDALGRQISVEEINIVNGQAERYITRFEYDLLGNLTRLIDAQGNVKTMEYDALSRRLRMVDPNRGETRYAYDDNGNLVRKEDALGRVIHYTYDAANRPLMERWSFNNGQADVINAVYHYDGAISLRHPNAQNTMGQIAYIEDQAGSVHFSYDPRGNIIGQVRHFADEGLTFVTGAEFDALDRPVRVIYPDGMAVTYEYNARNLLERIPGFVENIAYTASGQRTAIHYANGVETTYDYDDRLRLEHLVTRNGQGAIQDLTYGFDAVSNVVSITDARPDRTTATDQSQTFAYDGLYRLLNATGAYGAIDFGYDRIGNMTSKTSTAEDARLNLGEMKYGANGAGPHALTSAGGETYSYDANGNLLQNGSTTYRWDPRNQLLSVEDGETLSTYVYGAEGERTHQTVRRGDNVTTTLYAGPTVEVRGGELLYYIFDDEDRIARLSLAFDATQLAQSFGDTPAGALPITERSWYIADHLGGTSTLVDENGQVVAEMGYYPYGLIRYETNGDEIVYGFTGKELDASGLHFFEKRYYDAQTGRFLSVDPLFVESADKGLNAPQLLNLYAYTLNNPLKYTDPSGMSPEDETNETAKNVAGAAASGASGAVGYDYGGSTGVKGGVTGAVGAYNVVTGAATAFDSDADVVSRTKGGIDAIGGLASLGEFVLQHAGSGVGASRVAGAALGTTAFVAGFAVLFIDMGTAPARAMHEAKQRAKRQGMQEGKAVGFMAGLLGLDWRTTANEYGYRGMAPNKYAYQRMQGHNDALLKGWKKAASASQEMRQAALRRLAEKMANDPRTRRFANPTLDDIVYEGANGLRRHYGGLLK